MEDWEEEQRQTRIQEAKKVAVVNWWKERANTWTRGTQSAQELCETLKEQANSDMRQQVIHLTASLRPAQGCVTEQQNSKVLIDKDTSTERAEADRAVGNEVNDGRDASSAHQVTTDRLVETLRRMEAMVSNALEAAELVRDSEQRVSQVKVRLESVSQRMEEALGRTTHTDQQLSLLEAGITEKNPAQVGFFG